MRETRLTIRVRDVLILGHALHNWGLKENRLLLYKAYAAAPSASKWLRDAGFRETCVSTSWGRTR
jgi:hypothetical protein